MFYKDNTHIYILRMGGVHTESITVHSGVRQGCPLSPYLFLIIMTALFHDIHADPNLSQNLEVSLIGSSFSSLKLFDWFKLLFAIFD